VQAASLAAADGRALAWGAGGGTCAAPGLESGCSTMVHRVRGVDLKISSAPPPHVPLSRKRRVPGPIAGAGPLGKPSGVRHKHKGEIEHAVDVFARSLNGGLIVMSVAARLGRRRRLAQRGRVVGLGCAWL
jgi:hypothetical protein